MMLSLRRLGHFRVPCRFYAVGAFHPRCQRPPLSALRTLNPPLTSLNSPYCSSPAKASLGDPPQFLFSLFDCKGREGKLKYPHPKLVGRFARTFFGAGGTDEVDMLALTDKFFQVKYKDTSTQFATKPAAIQSESLSVKIRDDSSSSSEREQALQDLGDLLLAVPPGKIGYKRFRHNAVDYFIILFRVVKVMQKTIARNEPGEMFVLQSIALDSVKQQGSHAAAYFLWVGLIQAGNAVEAGKILNEVPEVMEYLQDELLLSAEEYHLLNDKPVSVIYGNIPPAFVLGDLDTFYKSVQLAVKDEVLLAKIVAFRALGLWNAGKFSKGLKDLGFAADLLMQMIKTSNPSSSDFGSLFCIVFDKILSDCIKGHKSNVENGGDTKEQTQKGMPNYAPAFQFIDLLCGHLSSKHKHNLVPYMYCSYLKRSEDKELVQKSKRFLKDYPQLKTVSDKAALRIFSPEVDLKKGKKLYESYLSNLNKAGAADIPDSQPLKKTNKAEVHKTDSGTEKEKKTEQKSRSQPLPDIEPNTAPEPITSSPLSEQSLNETAAPLELDESVVREMIEIRVLERLRVGSVDAALEYMGGEWEGRKIAPSMQVYMKVLKEVVLLYHRDNKDLFPELKRAVPEKSEVMGRICEYQTILLMKRSHDLFPKPDEVDAGNVKALEAVNWVIKAYEMAIQEENIIEFKNLDDNLSKMKNYLRLFAETSFLQKSSSEEESPSCSEAVLGALKIGGEGISAQFGDHSITGLYWETLFFSGKFKLEQEADEYIKAHPAVATSLNFDRLVERARRTASLELLSSLMELSLQMNLDPYEKSRAFEGVIMHHCLGGNLKLAMSTFDTAQSLDIPVGPEAAATLLALQKAPRVEKKKEGIFSNIVAMFRNKEK